MYCAWFWTTQKECKQSNGPTLMTSCTRYTRIVNPHFLAPTALARLLLKNQPFIKVWQPLKVTTTALEKWCSMNVGHIETFFQGIWSYFICLMTNTRKNCNVCLIYKLFWYYLVSITTLLVPVLPGHVLVNEKYRL